MKQEVRIKVHRTEKISPISGNAPNPQNPPKGENKKNKDKPFCELLDEVIKKAYPNLR